MWISTRIGTVLPGFPLWRRVHGGKPIRDNELITIRFDQQCGAFVIPALVIPVYVSAETLMIRRIVKRDKRAYSLFSIFWVHVQFSVQPSYLGATAAAVARARQGSRLVLPNLLSSRSSSNSSALPLQPSQFQHRYIIATTPHALTYHSLQS
jgi:hypothetical protein